MPDFPSPNVDLSSIVSYRPWADQASSDPAGGKNAGVHGAMLSHLVGTPSLSTAQGTGEWRAADDLAVYRNNTAASSRAYINTYGFSYNGPYGAMPQTAWQAAGNPSDFVQGTVFDTAVLEFVAFINTTQAAQDDDHGLGISTTSLNSTTPWGDSSTRQYIQVYRKTGSGWTLVTRDGTTESEASEASDTADGNMHVFRIEWDASEVRLYVDGTLKITKTTNRPSVDGLMPQWAGFRSASADSDNVIGLHSVWAYWKAA